MSNIYTLLWDTYQFKFNIRIDQHVAHSDRLGCHQRYFARTTLVKMTACNHLKTVNSKSHKTVCEQKTNLIIVSDWLNAKMLDCTIVNAKLSVYLLFAHLLFTPIEWISKSTRFPTNTFDAILKIGFSSYGYTSAKRNEKG